MMASSSWSRPSSYHDAYNINVPLDTYRGHCHCGRFQYEFIHPSLTRTDVEVVNCNCTLCIQRGYLLVYVDLLRMLTHGEELTPRYRYVEKNHMRFTKGSVGELSVYKFATGSVSHRFCPTCGSGLMAEGPIAIAVNIRNIIGIDVSKLRLKPWNGIEKGRPPMHELPGIAMLNGKRHRDKGIPVPV